MRAASITAQAAGTPRLVAPAIKHTVLNEVYFTAASQFTRLSGSGGGVTDTTAPTPGGQTSQVRFSGMGAVNAFFATTLPSTWNLSNSIFRFRARVQAYTSCRSLTIRLAESATAYNAGNYVTQDSKAKSSDSIVGNWFPANIFVNDSFLPSASALTGTVNLANINYVVFILSEVSGQTCNIDLSRIQNITKASTRPKCVIWHDDLILAGGNSIKSRMDTYGFVGSEAAELEMIDAGTVYMAGSDVATYRAAGWTMSSHATTNPEHVAEPADNVMNQAYRNRLAANRRGYGQEPADFTYWGSLNAAVAYEAIKSSYRSARWNTGLLSKVETQPPGDPWMVKAFLAATSDTFTANWQPYLATAVANGGIAQFVFHQDVNTNSTFAAEFDKLLTWLDQNRANIDVVTYPQALAASVA